MQRRYSLVISICRSRNAEVYACHLLTYASTSLAISIFLSVQTLEKHVGGGRSKKLLKLQIWMHSGLFWEVIIICWWNGPRGSYSNVSINATQSCRSWQIDAWHWSRFKLFYFDLRAHLQKPNSLGGKNRYLSRDMMTAVLVVDNCCVRPSPQWHFCLEKCFSPLF